MHLYEDNYISAPSVISLHADEFFFYLKIMYCIAIKENQLKPYLMLLSESLESMGHNSTFFSYSYVVEIRTEQCDEDLNLLKY